MAHYQADLDLKAFDTAATAADNNTAAAATNDNNNNNSNNNDDDDDNCFNADVLTITPCVAPLGQLAASHAVLFITLGERL